MYQIHTFNNNLNDEEMITFYLMCEILNKIDRERKTVTEKTRQNMLRDKTISS